MATVNSTSRVGQSGLLRHSVFSLFVAGALSVLVFHQGTVTILHLLGFGNPPFPTTPARIVPIPQIWAWVFWGGVWGIFYGLAEKYFPEGASYWVAAFLFGAILPDLVLWFVVFPLRGQPIGGGWVPARIAAFLLVHGMWGLGTGLFLHWRPNSQT
jgi:hypothetical protein